MNQYQITSLSLNLLGIYSIIEAIPLLRELSQVFAWRESQIQMEGGPIQPYLLLIGILISFGLLMMLGIVLILFSKSLAKQMTKKDEIRTEATRLTARNIQSVAFSVVGPFRRFSRTSRS